MSSIVKVLKKIVSNQRLMVSIIFSVIITGMAIALVTIFTTREDEITFASVIFQLIICCIYFHMFFDRTVEIDKLMKRSAIYNGTLITLIILKAIALYEKVSAADFFIDSSYIIICVFTIIAAVLTTTIVNAISKSKARKKIKKG